MTKTSRKSSITLPPPELALVARLKRQLKLKSNVEVIRRSLRLMAEGQERQLLRERYKAASKLVRQTSSEEVTDLGDLAFEGLE